MKGNINFLKIPVNRIIALVLMDIMSIVVASFVAIYIRFDFKFNGIPGEYLIKFEHILPYNILLTLLFFTIWKLYKSVWRYASATELINIVFATTCASVAQTVLCRVINEGMPRSYYVLYWFLLFGMTCLIRFSYRILRLINSKRSEIRLKKNGNNVMLAVGNGQCIAEIFFIDKVAQHKGGATLFYHVGEIFHCHLNVCTLTFGLEVKQFADNIQDMFTSFLGRNKLLYPV